MTRIYLIRHCEAEGNIYRRAHGHYDGKISPKGARQIAALAERFRNVPVDALYSSDLIRTVATAGAVTKYHDLELRTDPRLREMNLGVWEDVPFGNLGWAEPENMYAFNNDPAAWYAEGGEPYGAAQARMRETLLELAARHDGQTVAVVSHGMVIRAFLADVLGIPSGEINAVGHADNTAVSLLEIDGDRIGVIFRNDAGHLSGDLSTFSRQSWWRTPGKPDPNNVRFVPLDPETEPERYTAFYKKTWRAVHGSLAGFQPSPYLDAAVRHVRTCPEALMTIVRPDGEVVGITELDSERGQPWDAGWICLCFVEEPYRRSLLGVQLIGHAVSVFRRMGRRALRLSVSEDNTAAIRFYEASEFYPAGSVNGVFGKLTVMEKKL